MRVALVHDWLITNRGGEKVLDALCELFPSADLFTLIHRPGTQSERIESRRIFTSPLQKLPGIERRYRHLLPMLPAAIATFDLRGYDLVLSSSHCVAKGVRTPAGIPHLSYVHAPMRYMWNRFDDYFGPGRASPPVRAAAHLVRPFLQAWDRHSATGPGRLVANSHYIAAQLAQHWGRQAAVVHPPVELPQFAEGPLGRGRGGYFLWLGAFAPYKRVDLAIEAFRGLPDETLYLAGSGQEGLGDVPKNVRVLGQVPHDELADLYRDAAALLFTAEEDFGITPLESQAVGRPVIAFGRGGALETVKADTGLFFAEQTAASIQEAVRRFRKTEATFSPEVIRTWALRFGRGRFQRELLDQLAQLPGSDSAVADARRLIVGLQRASEHAGV